MAIQVLGSFIYHTNQYVCFTSESDTDFSD